MTKPTPEPTNSTGAAPVYASYQTGTSLLLISDAPERLQRIESILGISEVAMTKAESAEELAESRHNAHDLVIVDVEPQRLTGVLKTLRESSGHASIPVLVDRSRLPHDSTLAGVLPTYRAMPCSFDEVVKLARRRLIDSAYPRPTESRIIRPMF